MTYELKGTWPDILASVKAVIELKPLIAAVPVAMANPPVASYMHGFGAVVNTFLTRIQVQEGGVMLQNSAYSVAKITHCTLFSTAGGQDEEFTTTYIPVTVMGASAVSTPYPTFDIPFSLRTDVNPAAVDVYDYMHMLGHQGVGYPTCSLYTFWIWYRNAYLPVRVYSQDFY